MLSSPVSSFGELQAGESLSERVEGDRDVSATLAPKNVGRVLCLLDAAHARLLGSEAD